ncbi:MAG: TolB family protein, partial [Gemmatimonadaceae bacterium]
MPLFIVAALLLHTALAPAPGLAGARNPAYALDGRLAVSVQGDLWIVSTHGAWTRVTTGPAWDREPAWTPDGSAIVFSSDRAGTFGLWRVAAGAGAEPERLTASRLPDAEPVVTRDGRIIFVRGRLGAATLWVRSSDGSEARLTNEHAAEDWPAISSDRARLAYVSLGDGTRRLHVRTLATNQDTVVLTDARIEHPAWSPDGTRLSWTATGARGAVYVTPLDGHYVNLVSTRHA